MIKVKEWLDNFIRDKHGHIVLWQNPNIPLWLWFISTILSRILPYGQADFVASLVSFGSIFTWAYLEITSGVNGFRRSVGCLVLTLAILGRI